MARMSDPSMVAAIKQAVTIPVMAKARIGHFVEAQILEALDIDYIDESEARQPPCAHAPLLAPAVWSSQQQKQLVSSELFVSNVHVPLDAGTGCIRHKR